MLTDTRSLYTNSEAQFFLHVTFAQKYKAALRTSVDAEA